VFVDFVSSSTTLELAVKQPVKAYISYFVGNDPTVWAYCVRSFGDVRYAGLYPGSVWHGPRRV
jgi:hypothetical protein